MLNDPAKLIELMGWVGAIEVLLAYGLISLNKVDSKSLFFQLLNLTGGLLLIVYTLSLKSYASAFVNIVWVLVAIISIYKIKK
ncbi:MAG: hypothetical protein RL711_1104 [Bacteroidota bacterium]|jgi:hypothetical protein